jgi:hypothetical protein
VDALIWPLVAGAPDTVFVPGLPVATGPSFDVIGLGVEGVKVCADWAKAGEQPNRTIETFADVDSNKTASLRLERCFKICTPSPVLFIRV